MAQENRQGSLQAGLPVEGPDVWYSKDYANRSDWHYILTDEDLAELDSTVFAAEALGKPIHEINKEEFPLPTLGPKLEAWLHEVDHGRGFALIRGFPVHRYTRQQTMIGYWGFSLYWGQAVSQNKKGHLIGHIKDIGHDASNPVTRLYATAAAQPWHNDGPADIVSLLCLTPAREGGLSSWSSSIAVYNEILRTAPDLIPVMAGPWFFDRKNEVPPGKLPYFMIPIFNFFRGFLSVNFSDNYYFLSQRHPEVPRLTEQHLRAIAKFNELAASPELRMDYQLLPGDIQLLSNHTCLHSRTAFVDDEENGKKRHLLRLWVAPEGSRPLPEVYEDLMGSNIQAGSRGGIRCEGYAPTIPLEAE